ncbi:hypothetical protein F2P81_024481 [Scophthalmus maximus]|uniref:Uncharacterized protein n=1 Tax=Scophthalmus maximus TaxID=52904 RepID=A0A6A4RXQ3_SCOMX|nr:hypothetical protein F2P81_024481 [Scophthalmus maximus]
MPACWRRAVVPRKTKRLAAYLEVYKFPLNGTVPLLLTLRVLGCFQKIQTEYYKYYTYLFIFLSQHSHCRAGTSGRPVDYFAEHKTGRIPLKQAEAFMSVVFLCMLKLCKVKKPKVGGEGSSSPRQETLKILTLLKRLVSRPDDASVT